MADNGLRRYFGIQHAFAALFLEELCRLGVRDVCVAPGSRSTPLVVSLNALKSVYNLRVHTHIDERGLGFFALGLAKATGRPAVVLTTSGTAVANLLPAVIEASQSDHPMIVVSADRPPELIGVGANQAIVQPGLFGDYVRLEIDAQVPHSSIGLVPALVQAGQVWQAANFPRRPGPVHINLPFDEPLLAELLHDSHVVFDDLSSWMASSAPYQPPTGLAEMNASELSVAVPADILALLTRAESGLIVVGELSDFGDVEAVLQLAERVQWPVCVDTLSGCLAQQGHRFFAYSEYFLGDLLVQGVVPDVVLHLGGPLVSRRLQAYVAARTQGVVHVSETERVVDPQGAVTHRVVSPVRHFAPQLISLHLHVQDWLDFHAPSMEFMDRKIGEELGRIALGTEASVAGSAIGDAVWTSELAVVRELTRLIPEHGTLFVGNSLPIRELLWVGVRDGVSRTVLGNRGASGIDGLVSTAAGVATGMRSPVTLLIGDMSVLHDLSGWLWLSRLQYPIIMVVLNNGGGGIFDHLPIANQQPDILDDYYRMARSVDFSALAKGVAVPMVSVVTLRAFSAAYADALKSANTKSLSTVIEVSVSDSVQDLRELERALKLSLA